MSINQITRGGRNDQNKPGETLQVRQEIYSLSRAGHFGNEKFLTGKAVLGISTVDSAVQKKPFQTVKGLKKKKHHNYVTFASHREVPKTKGGGGITDVTVTW